MLALATALFLDGYSGNGFRRSTTASSGPSAGIEGAGPILDFSKRDPASVPMPPKQIALTFDDGPDPRWTPAILRALTRHHAKATFFVVGAKVARHPALTRRLLAEGHELGSHTFTHANMGTASAVRRNAELSLTQVALAGAAGVRTSLLRLPYSSGPEELTRGDVVAARSAARYGYLLVASTNDSRDWQRPGVPAIVARSLPSGGAGAVILMHDSGGDRHQTVAALERLLPALEQQGYQFVTVSQVIAQARSAVNPRVSTAARIQGRSVLGALTVSRAIAALLRWILLPIVLLAALRAILVVVFAARHVRARARTVGGYRPPVSVLVPAYNEGVVIAATVRSLASSVAGDDEIVVVDDGSTDDTAAIVDGLALPRVRLLRQGNGGKANALNNGIRNSRHDVIVMVDADTQFEPTTIDWLVRPLADPTVGAVSGNTKVANRGRLLGRWQHIEYVLGFNLDRRMFDILRCMPTVPGAIGAFRRGALAGVGNMSSDTLAEDTDVTLALNRAGWRVVYEEQARAWTEAPGSVGALWRQRYRWSYGTMQAMWKHRHAVRERGPLGRVGLPYVLAFQILLPLMAPAVDLFTLFGLLFQDPKPVIAYWLVFNGVNILLGAYALRLDGERLGVLWSVPLQQIVYRQLMYLVVIQSVRTALSGQVLPWHSVPRQGDLRVG